MKRAIVFDAKTVRSECMRREEFFFAFFQPRQAGHREIAVRHQNPNDRLRNQVFARDGGDARAEFLHVTFLDPRRWRQGFQPKNGRGLVPVAPVKAAEACGPY